MTVLRLKAADLMDAERPLELAERINDWHLLGGTFEIERGAGRLDYKLEAWFPSDEAAMEFLLHLHNGDEAAALTAWRAQP